jgi:hypothetical protein
MEGARGRSIRDETYEERELIPARKAGANIRRMRRREIQTIIFRCGPHAL